MAERREVVFENPDDDYNGVSLTVTRKGVEVSGWYDGGHGGMYPVFVPWEKIDEARREVFVRKTAVK